jgi:hypothetical protein
VTESEHLIAWETDTRWINKQTFNEVKEGRNSCYIVIGRKLCLELLLVNNKSMFYF